MAKPQKPFKVELRIAEVDWSPCEAVREELDQATVDEYAETESEWSKKKPAEVWAGGGKYFAGDGGHRKAAKLKLGKKKILCLVHHVATAKAALKLARLHAFGPANAAPGLERSKEDKRKTVKACLADPKYADRSDREVARICRVGRWLVGQVRDDLAGRDPNPRRVTPVATNAPAGPDPAEPAEDDRQEVAAHPPGDTEQRETFDLRKLRTAFNLLATEVDSAQEGLPWEEQRLRKAEDRLAAVEVAGRLLKELSESGIPDDMPLEELQEVICLVKGVEKHATAIRVDSLSSLGEIIHLQESMRLQTEVQPDERSTLNVVGGEG